MMLGTPARFARLSLTNVVMLVARRELLDPDGGADGDWQSQDSVVPSTQTDPRVDERRPACSALRDG